MPDYVYDRDSAMYSRDALEAVLQALVNDPNVKSISILAHSMGNYLAIESLQADVDPRPWTVAEDPRRDAGVADIDIDVFRRQIAEIDAGPRPAGFTLFVSRDDRALSLSSFLARDSTRLGALDPDKEPYRSILEQGRVHVIDLTGMASSDFTNHGKFASGEVVGAIGERLAEGQSLSEAEGGLVESLGTFTSGAIDVAAGVATGAVAAPSEIFDPTEAREVGRHRGASHDLKSVIRNSPDQILLPNHREPADRSSPFLAMSMACGAIPKS